MKPGDRVIVPSLMYPHRAIVVTVLDGLYGQRVDVKVVNQAWESGPISANVSGIFLLIMVKLYAPE